MKQPLYYSSWFTGIGGFEAGFPEGMQPVSFSEFDKNRQKVLAEHHPDVPQLGDIRDVTARDIPGRPELFCAGFPCKGVSIATPDRHGVGLTKGQSALWFVYRELVEAYLRLIDDKEPRWVVLENVDGLLDSRGGRDFATVVQGLLDLGYGVSWRVVDARLLGANRPTVQKRKRVLVVGHLGGDPRPAGQVLGLTGPGADAYGPRDGGLEDTGPGTNTFALGGDLVRVWRKSSNSQVAIRFHDHPTCPAPRPDGRYPEHRCQGTFNPAYRETWYTDGRCNTLASSDGGGPLRQKHLVAQHGGLRTLTPLEWERLQGFPDNWTAMIPRSARFNALGDAIHVGTSQWLGRRLLSVHESLPQLRTA